MEFTFSLTTGLTIALIISFGFNILFTFLINRALKQVEVYEQYVMRYQVIFEKTQSVVREGEKRITELDTTEAFKSDDEIGFFFDQVKNIQDILTKLTLSENVYQQQGEEKEK